MCGENKDSCGMRKERITLEDGRYLVYYWFKKRAGDGSDRRGDGDSCERDERSGESNEDGGRN